MRTFWNVTIDDIILYMFKHFEKIHGSVIFRRAICYMTVCKNGISNNELEDILSLGYSDFWYLFFKVKHSGSKLKETDKN